ncbi:Rrf2 family transcriptional regulator [Chitinasiproducens palmae]|uniref:Transcriptional regulator, BadM/Rrf2 family n=1 Tax=Chitinasiproducens palmae TaxID=1770053 RepID=A0A1H2PMS9_9BURK|nr:Rrf2 family transcriptional regulator [Chitinasiproducens palmae]SDV47983.1 transcriptional regulator, BadM/Rrf2 family [Chitinasiproducens palmae]
MRLTRYTDYALRTLVYLGLRPGQQASIAAIAQAYDISENHLTKVVHHLGKLGLILTTRGRGGGIRLARPAEDIVIGDVVRQVEDDMVIVECFGEASCAVSGTCRLQGILGEALQAFLAVLDRYTLADVLAFRPAEMAAVLGVPIDLSQLRRAVAAGA